MSSTGDNEKPKVEKPKKLPLPVKLVVGAIAGIVGTTCIFPIDIVKTRLQAGDGKTNVLKVIRNMLVNEGGPRAFYRGIGANLIGVTPEKALKLAVNDTAREFLENEDGSISLINEIISGATAGMVQVIATNPMEITKIRLQMQMLEPPEHRKNMVQIVKELGVKGLYSGTTATLTRDVPFSVIFFPLYANVKAFYSDYFKDNELLASLLSGATAGAVAAGAVTPADVIKTRLQLAGGSQKYKNVPHAFKTILKEDGPKAFFRGAVPRMLVMSPLFAIALLSFDAQKKYMIDNGML